MSWRRVHLIGSIAPHEKDTLRARLDCRDIFDPEVLDRMGPLSFASAALGLPPWPAPGPSDQIEAVGNMSERGFEPDDVARQLDELAHVAPSLAIVVHVGEEDEGRHCVATVVKVRSRPARVAEPQQRLIPNEPKGQLTANVLEQIKRQKRETQ